ncbi:hypothetical protein PENTCL1PPCAC_15087, partial [Pristionchus entomophagus]
FQVHSPRSLGAYKFLLYQIVFWPLLSQQFSLFGPVFVWPIIGAYHYIDFTDNPAVIHGIMCTWVLISAFDVDTIVDGFSFRLRVLLAAFYPRYGGKLFWV